MRLIDAETHERRYPGNGRTREFYQDPRLYISIEDESVLANFANRTSRPYNEYKKLVPDILRRLGIDPTGVKASWSRHAGCTMCPCSPGFILTRVSSDGMNRRIRGGDVGDRFDIWAKVGGDDAAVVATPEAAAEVAHRAEQLARQL